MHKKHSQEPPSSEPPSKVLQILSWLKDFTITVPYIGSCLALLYLATGEPNVGYLLVASSIMYLIVELVSHLIMMKIFGLQVRVEALVDTGEMFAVTVFLLLTVVSLLVQSPLCMS